MLKLDNNLLKKLSLFVLLALLLPFFLELFVLQRAGSQILKGDFPAFYSAAKIVSSGQASSLYDFSLQRQIQNEFWPELNGNYHAFVYPPSFAFFLAPLAFFSAMTAKFLYLLIQLCFFCAALYLACSYIPRIKDYFFESVVFSLAFLPMYSAIVSGQNTALSLFLLSAAIYFFHKPSKYSELLSGLMIGLWFFKPQYPVLFLVAFLLFRKWKLVIGVSLGVLLHLGIALCLYGPGVFSTWILALENYLPLELQNNSYQMISLIGVARALNQTLACDWLVCAAYLLSALIAGCFFINLRKEKELNVKTFLTLPVCILLISPHSLFYDLGLLIIPFLYFYEAKKAEDFILLILIFFSATIFSLSRGQLSFSPFVLLLLLVLVWQSRKIKNLTYLNLI